MEKSHYSGKAGRHTAKVQYTVNINGLIVRNTRHSPGRVHDITVVGNVPKIRCIMAKLFVNVHVLP